MSNVARWFGSRRREKALKMLERHMDNVLKCVRALRQLLNVWNRGEEELDPSYLEVKSYEKTADVIRRKTARLLAGGGELDAVERTFLLRLMGRIDKIADWSLEAARGVLILSKNGAPMEVRALYLDFASKLEVIVERTFEVVRSLQSSPLKALEETDEVERLEEEIDAVYAESRERLLSLARHLPAPVTVLLYEALNALENAADACEDSCDIVRELVVRLSW